MNSSYKEPIPREAILVSYNLVRHSSKMIFHFQERPVITNIPWNQVRKEPFFKISDYVKFQTLDICQTIYFSVRLEDGYQLFHVIDDKFEAQSN